MPTTGYRLPGTGNRPAQYISARYISKAQVECDGDYAKAFDWFDLAGGAGHPDAQFALGYMYATGKQFPVDSVLALMWFSLAAAQMSGDMRKNAIEARDLTARELTREQLARAESLAREWKSYLEP